MSFKRYVFILMALLVSITSCKKFLDIDPPKSQLVGESVFKDILTAESAMAGIYYQLGSNSYAGGSVSSITYIGALLADAALYLGNSTDYIELNNNTILPTNGQVTNIWNNAYFIVYQANLMIEKLQAAEELEKNVRERLIGEALFIRGFTYFYLVNLFGDVPFAVSSDYRTNSTLSRMPAAQVYSHIVEDLETAASLLPDEYRGAERVRPTKWASLSMLARTFLYLEEWEKAESYATQVLTASSLFNLESPDKVFFKNSREAIWQLIPSHQVVNNYTNEGNIFIIRGTPSGLVLREETAAQIWEPNDLRKHQWVGHIDGSFGRAFFPWKYKEWPSNATGTEYSMIIRVSELYLIRAEALARLGEIEAAKSNLNKIRSRAGLPDTQIDNRDAIITAILIERQREFFAEWGHRWFDLKRMGLSEDTFTPFKPDWQASDILLPIPEKEMLNNLKLTQNPGY